MQILLSLADNLVPPFDAVDTAGSTPLFVSGDPPGLKADTLLKRTTVTQ
ncbi:hypothetical protein [Anaerophaga thermohalophila]|nr:hypothetical protein [Anaerophaga thermohalophila]